MRENPVQKTTFGKYQNTFSPTHYNQRSDEEERVWWLFYETALAVLVISNQKWRYLTTQFFVSNSCTQWAEIWENSQFREVAEFT